MKKFVIYIFFSHITHTILVDKIPPKWLKNTTFYLEDKGDSMLLGNLLIRLDRKKMDFGVFIAEMLYLLRIQKREKSPIRTTYYSIGKKAIIYGGKK